MTIDITGGQIDITASDDGVNAAGGRDGSSMEKGQDPFVSMEGAYISISGGSLRINASGDGISSLDYNGKAVVTGGIFASSGASGMAQNFDPSSTQGIIMLTLNPQEAGTQIALKNSDGTEQDCPHFVIAEKVGYIVLATAPEKELIHWPFVGSHPGYHDHNCGKKYRRNHLKPIGIRPDSWRKAHTEKKITVRCPLINRMRFFMALLFLRIFPIN